jgi:hypothetical protein
MFATANRRTDLKIRGFLTAALLLCASSACFGAATFNFSGVFGADDNVVLFTYQVQTTGQVSVFTTSYATGGFQTVLSLFDSNRLFQFDNNGFSNATDASLTWNSVAGERYTIALTEYDNLAFGPTLDDGFTEQGNGNFTATPPFNLPVPGGAFLLPGGEQRTGNWAVSFSSAVPSFTATQIPEPASGLLLMGGVALLAGWKKWRKQ